MANSSLTIGNNSSLTTPDNTVTPFTWTTPTFNAADYTALSPMTWTVAAGNVNTMRYIVLGKMMTVAFVIASTSVGGTPTTQFRIKIPGGYLAAVRMLNGTGLILDNNAPTTAYVDTLGAGNNYFGITRTDRTNWALSSGLTYIYGQITFEIQ